MSELAEIGVLGMAVPEEYGGLGLPVLDTALVLEEIAKGCYVTAMAVLGEVGVQTRDHRRPMRQRTSSGGSCRRVHGRVILAVCMTEPHAGTDVANYRTNTDIVGDKLVLNGVKTLISRVDEAGMFVVFTPREQASRVAKASAACWWRRHAGFACTGALSHDGRREPAEVQLRELRAAARKPGPARGRLQQAAHRLQHAALPQSQHLARPGGRRVRGGGASTRATQRLRPADRGVPGHAMEARRNVPGYRGRPQHALSRVRHGQSVPRSHEAAVAKMYCNEMASASPTKRSRSMAATASPTNSRCRASIAARATERWAAAPPRR